LAAEDSTNFVIPSPTVKLWVAVVPMIKALVEIQADNQLPFFFCFCFCFLLSYYDTNT
jgi:hypothetical protein